MATTVQNPRRQKCFAVIETVEGTLQAPTSASMFIPAGFVDITQSPNFSDSEEIKESRDVTERFQGRWNPGEFTIPMYLRPSGTAGTAPDGDALLQSLMGSKATVALTSVTYSQAVDKPSFSLWRKVDESVLWARGCVVTGLKMDVSTGAGGAMVTFTGQFAEMGWGGTTVVDGGQLIAATVINLPTDKAKLYKAGTYVEFTDGTTVWSRTNQGYRIASVDYANDTITLAHGLEIALDNGDTVRPWLPAGTEVGAPIEMRKAYCALDSTTTVVKSISMNIGDPITYLEEITEDSYPVTYAGIQRDISGTIVKMMRQEDIADFYYGDSNTQRDLDLIVGNVAGSIVTFNFPKAEIEFPSIANADPTIEESINWKALATVGEDSCTIAFT
jgi:hypothetical protein